MDPQLCQFNTPRLQLRPWRRNDIDDLVQMSHDPGCRAQWGMFKDPLTREKAARWTEIATESMSQHGLGSWAVLEREKLIGCLNLLQRNLDGATQPMIMVLEFRLQQAMYRNGQALEATQAVLAFAQQHHHLETYHIFLTPHDQLAQGVAHALGMVPQKTATFDRVQIEVYVSAKANGASPG